MTWQEFIHMGGYGAYVWSAYALTAVVLIWNLIVPLRRRREVLARLRRWYDQETGR
ncbi:heme exporter protein D [Methylomarinovum tepidoasis]|uniref:Heme exporter protein D n=1 Tax=Methylomarinovum tepidoasis TaxID=2840183 RepID=A0AAU9CHP7_9GAMM|nr:heme exporter protein CcmD [Methylomarinovum sp. IN45]BCX88881.1 heme exporter protein D [Methylomarinovum sp. IN45]